MALLKTVMAVCFEGTVIAVKEIDIQGVALSLGFVILCQVSSLYFNLPQSSTKICNSTFKTVYRVYMYELLMG